MDVTMFFCGVWPPFCEAERGHTCSFKRLATSHRPAPLSSPTEAGQPKTVLFDGVRAGSRDRVRASRRSREAFPDAVAVRAANDDGKLLQEEGPAERRERASPRARTSPRRRLPPPETQARPRNGPRCTARSTARVDPACAPNANVAAFDLDDTLQKTRSGRPGYAVSELDDFVFWSERVADAVRSVHAAATPSSSSATKAASKARWMGSALTLFGAAWARWRGTWACPCAFFCGTQKGARRTRLATANREPARGDTSRRSATAASRSIWRRRTTSGTPRGGLETTPTATRRSPTAACVSSRRGVLRRARVRRPRAEGAAERADAS